MSEFFWDRETGGGGGGGRLVVRRVFLFPRALVRGAPPQRKSSFRLTT